MFCLATLPVDEHASLFSTSVGVIFSRERFLGLSSKKSSFRTMYSSARAVLTKHHRLGRGAVYFCSWMLGVRAEVPAGWVLVRRLFLACRQLRLLCVLTWPLLWALAVLVSVLPLVRTRVPWPLWPHLTLITFLKALSPNTVILRVRALPCGFWRKTVQSVTYRIGWFCCAWIWVFALKAKPIRKTAQRGGKGAVGVSPLRTSSAPLLHP